MITRRVLFFFTLISHFINSRPGFPFCAISAESNTLADIVDLNIIATPPPSLLFGRGACLISNHRGTISLMICLSVYLYNHVSVRATISKLLFFL